MKILTVLSFALLTGFFSCTADEETGDANCVNERLAELQAETRPQDAGSLTVYENKSTEERYYVYYYAQDKGMLDVGGYTITDADCNQICQNTIMMHWTACVDNLNNDDVQEVEVIWQQD